MATEAPAASAPEEVVPKFNAPVIQDNATGWGPCEMPDQFFNMPYQPFSKGDRLGKVNFKHGTIWALFNLNFPSTDFRLDGSCIPR
jgi:hypothetical protein